MPTVGHVAISQSGAKL